MDPAWINHAVRPAFEDYTAPCERTSSARWRKRERARWHWRGCRVIGLSVDKVEDHLRWAADIEDLAGTKLDYPLIADEDLSIAKRYDMLLRDRGRFIRRPHCRRQHDRPPRLLGRPRQEGEDEPYLPNEHGTQLRRAASGHRFVSADREPQGCDPGESVCVGIPGQRATNDLVVSAFTRTVYSTHGSKSEPTEPKGTLVSTTG